MFQPCFDRILICQLFGPWYSTMIFQISCILRCWEKFCCRLRSFSNLYNSLCISTREMHYVNGFLLCRPFFVSWRWAYSHYELLNERCTQFIFQRRISCFFCSNPQTFYLNIKLINYIKVQSNHFGHLKCFSDETVIWLPPISNVIITKYSYAYFVFKCVTSLHVFRYSPALIIRNP